VSSATNGCMNMKKQLKMLFILLTIAFSIFNFTSITLFPAVNATYVEGLITQDTIWTLVDSPFVISNETIVCSNATLTIEPEVEVRFGGNFSITVEGKLVADGTKNKMIRFTSNELEPKAGAWGTLKFNSTQESSLSYCAIEYGLNGITVENGLVNIQKSTIRHNSEYGVAISGGYVCVENCEVLNNTIGGIFVSGSSQVSVQNNVINGNEDGIILNGNLTSEISITQNEISSNRHSGILCGADAYDNTIILNNTISKNSYGFYISSDAVTHITRNYILNNSVGIFYDSGIGHTAHFNDIYGNNLGMDVSSGASVDATCNYWGSKSGPYHETLNPCGKGNPVGGDGVNLDFIFFLTHPIDYNNTPPTAILWTDKVLVASNQAVTFIGTDSYDDGRVNYYIFDFGDGNSSDWTTLSLFTHNYSSTGIYNASLIVMDDFNTTSDITFAEINVTDLTPLQASITLSNYTVEYNEEVLVTVYVSDGVSAVENANVTLFSVRGGSFTPRSGLTNSTGYFTATFKAPNVTEITDVRIIARASKLFYADGSAHDYLKVLPPLTVQVSAEPPKLKSEDTATIIVQVTDSFEIPVTNASLTLSAENGNISATTGVTDLNGIAVFNFTASQTLTQINATFVVTATKTGYGKGQSLYIIPIEPKVLVVQVTAKSDATISEGKINATVHVAYGAMHVQEANVTIISENFPTTTGLTDIYGNATFVLTAPQVNAPLNVTIIARASKIGCADGENLLNVTINPGILDVTVTAEPSTVASRDSALVTVHVTCNATPVANTSITLSSSQGNLSATTGLTDSNGYCTFIFNAPRTTEQIPQIIIIANATKNGYISAENQTTILLIIIPIIIAVVVVILIKLKIIVLSTEEEE